MKNTTRKLRGYESLMHLWERFSNLVDQDPTSENIDLSNDLLTELENVLPFEDEEERTKWVDVSMTFKYWEDFEELTLRIINRRETKRIDKYIEAYNLVAQDVCNDANFFDLFNTFSKLSNGWVKPLTENWRKWELYLKENQDDWNFFTEAYKESMGEEYDLMKLYRKGIYGFETTTYPMFYRNDEEGKSDLIDCIFERYIEGLEDDEELWFYQRLIKELI